MVGDETDPMKGRELIHKLMLIEAILGTILTVPTVFFFRERPPTPPSASAELPRDNYKEGLQKILKDGNFLLLLGVVGFGLGVYNALATVVQTLINPFNYSQVTHSKMIEPNTNIVDLCFK